MDCKLQDWLKGWVHSLQKAYADVAQLAEQLICNQQVIGSSPIIGFIQFNIELYYGQIPEWPKGTDCKSAATCFDGSNPSLPIKKPQVV